MNWLADNFLCCLKTWIHLITNSNNSWNFLIQYRINLHDIDFQFHGFRVLFAFKVTDEWECKESSIHKRSMGDFQFIAITNTCTEKTKQKKTCRFTEKLLDAHSPQQETKEICAVLPRSSKLQAYGHISTEEITNIFLQAIFFSSFARVFFFNLLFSLCICHFGVLFCILLTHRK